MLKVEVVYALPGEQTLVELEVEAGTTAQQAIESSGLCDKFPDLKIAPGMIGVFSRKVSPDYVLQEGDRVEIYRELVLSPKEARRLRALKKQLGEAI